MSTNLNSQNPVNITSTSARDVDNREPLARALRPPREVPGRDGAEVYDALLHRLSARRSDTGNVGLLLGLTSCVRGSGVTTLAVNLAIRAADHGMGPVLLIDSNSQRPKLHKLFNVSPKIGLAHILADRTELAACVQPTSVVGLDLLPLGTNSLNRTRVEADQFEVLDAQLREHYSLVICDFPAASELGPTLLLAAMMDVTLMVIRAGHAAAQDAQRVVASLTDDGINLVGAVMTDDRHYTPRWLEKRL